jgi:hypothetical protein
LTDTNGRVRYAAATALERFGSNAMSAAPGLALLFSDPFEDVRKAATTALMEIDPEAATNAPVAYYNAQYGFRFSLSTEWKGYSELVRQWQGEAYSAAKDKQVTVEHGPEIILRDWRWTEKDQYQDIPILVFTRSQWRGLHEGKFVVGAGGVEYEIAHISNFVFSISSRFNADESVKGWKEATDIVERNRAANAPPLYPQ